mmetsp:Transcript_116633/g.371000  ORF Transcript_116633/g.371000 Transcript_116633/m.371000 type:complete len:219 (+) Transcript_116633:837-1493(+)
MASDGRPHARLKQSRKPPPRICLAMLARDPSNHALIAVAAKEVKSTCSCNCGSLASTECQHHPRPPNILAIIVPLCRAQSLVTKVVVAARYAQLPGEGHGSRASACRRHRMQLLPMPTSTAPDLQAVSAGKGPATVETPDDVELPSDGGHRRLAPALGALRQRQPNGAVGGEELGRRQGERPRGVVAAEGAEPGAEAVVDQRGEGGGALPSGMPRRRG